MRYRLVLSMKMNRPEVILIREGTSIIELAGLYGDDFLIELISGGLCNKKSFVFVGFYYITSRHTTIVGYPKYLSNRTNEEIISHVDLICQVISTKKDFFDKSLYSDDYMFRAEMIQSDYKRVDLYSIANYLINDYIENGLYCRSVKRTGNEIDSVDWDKTIEEIQPFIDGNNIIYPDVISTQTAPDNNNIVASVQGSVLIQCFNLLGSIGICSGIELPDSFKIIDNDVICTYVPFLKSVLTYTYNARDISLIKALIAWISKTINYEYRYGSTSFNIVWEICIKDVFENIVDTHSREPIYNIKNTQYVGIGESQPDALRAFWYNGTKCINIFDAKYYYPTLLEGKIIHAPANSDIIKQLSYHNYISSICNEDVRISNAFMIPEFTGFEEKGYLFRYSGYAKPDFTINPEIQDILKLDLKDNQTDFVLIYEINPEMLYRYCINRKSASKEDCYSFINMQETIQKEISGCKEV